MLRVRESTTKFSFSLGRVVLDDEVSEKNGLVPYHARATTIGGGGGGGGYIYTVWRVILAGIILCGFMRKSLVFLLAELIIAF